MTRRTTYGTSRAYYHGDSYDSSSRYSGDRYMKCPSCGTATPEGSKCRRCGTLVY